MSKIALIKEKVKKVLDVLRGLEGSPVTVWIITLKNNLVSKTVLWIRIQWGLWIRIQVGKNDPQKEKRLINLLFQSAGCSLWRAEGFYCSLDAF